MPALLLIARLLLGGVLAVAGVTKLADIAGSRKALVGFGVPASLAGPLGLLLPLLELTVALALIPRSTAPYGAASALVLLLIFVAAIGNSLARGRRPDCHCFGQLHSEPVGWRVLARNGVLSVIAAFVMLAGWTDPGPSATAWLIALSEWQLAVVLGGALALTGLGAQIVLLLRLVNQNGQMLQRLASPAPAPSIYTTAASATTTPSVLTMTTSSPAAPSLISVLTMTAPSPAAPQTIGAPATGRRVGSPAPPFFLPSVQGDQVSVETLRDLGKPTILFFSDPECATCLALLPEITQWRRDYADSFTLAIISRGTPEENRAKFGEQPLEWVLLQRDREVAGAYGIAATPSAVLLGANGTIGSQTALGEVEIRQLMAGLGRMPAPPRGEHLVAAPEFELADLDGQPVGPAQLIGRPTLVVFWNPTCPHCERMLDDLKAWEDLPLTERPQLLVVSTGTVERNRAEGFRSTVALDSGFTTGSRYGVEGTPSAVLIDQDGRLDGPPAVGAFAIFALAGRVAVLDADATDVPDADAAVASLPLPVLPADARPVQQSCTQDELLADGGIILYSGCRQQVTTLNATGAFVWECCDGDHDVDAIIAEVRDVFPTAEGLDRDVREVLDRLLQAGMIGAAGAPATTSPAETSATAV